jgi:hypothetical protein
MFSGPAPRSIFARPRSDDIARRSGSALLG